MSAPAGMIHCLHYPSPCGQADVLLIMLPGAGIEAEEFADQGMVAAVHARGLAVDIVVARPDLALYLEDRVTEALQREVVEPALARGCTRIWLLGISLGGMGALLYASAHEAEVEGLVLLAPFLGTRGTAAELARVGGLLAWSAEHSAATIPEQRLLTWLQLHLAHPEQTPKLYLGYGQRDRFAATHKMLAECLPPERVAVTAGEHDWASWTSLWHQLLGHSPFSPSADNARRCGGA
jgi:pimeloyl-ACP methyl ester carboxylesterase